MEHNSSQIYKPTYVRKGKGREVSRQEPLLVHSGVMILDFSQDHCKPRLLKIKLLNLTELPSVWNPKQARQDNDSRSVYCSALFTVFPLNTWIQQRKFRNRLLTFEALCIDLDLI